MKVGLSKPLLLYINHDILFARLSKVEVVGAAMPDASALAVLLSKPINLQFKSTKS